MMSGGSERVELCQRQAPPFLHGITRNPLRSGLSDARMCKKVLQNSMSYLAMGLRPKYH